MRVLKSNRVLSGLVVCAMCIGLSPILAEDAPAPNPLAGPAVPAPAPKPAEAAPAAPDAVAPGAPDAAAEAGKKGKKGRKKAEGGVAGPGVGAEAAGPAGAGAQAAHAVPLPPQVRDLLPRLTVIDQANLELANISQANGKADEVAASLKLIYDGKDNDACGAAHLLEGIWLAKENKTAEAEKALVLVTGPFAEAAARELARDDRVDPVHLQANLDTLITNLTGEKNLAYKGRVIEFAIQQARLADQPDLLVSTLKKVATWTNADEAIKIREAMELQLVADFERAQKLKEMRGPGGPGGPGGPRGPGGPGVDAGQAPAGPAAGPGVGMDKEKAIEQLQARAATMRANGEADKAAKIEAIAEKIKNGEITPEEVQKRMQERQNGQGGPGGPGGQGGPGGPGGRKGKKGEPGDKPAGDAPAGEADAAF